MKPTRAAMLALAVMLPAVARAGALDLTMYGRAYFDDNVYRSQDDPESDVIFSATPAIKISDRQEKFWWELGWGTTYERGIVTEHDFDLDNDVRAGGSYQLSNRTRLSLDDHFRYSPLRTDQQGDQGLDPDEGDALAISTNEKETLIQNDAILSVSHQFAPRLSGSYSLGYDLFDTSQVDRSDTQTFSSHGNLRYVLSARHQVGAGVGLTRQSFSGYLASPPSNTTFYQVNGFWSYQITETLSFSVGGGPTFVTNDQEEPDRVIRGVTTYPIFTEVTQPGTFGGFPDPDNPDGPPLRLPVPIGSILVPDFAFCATLTDDPSKHVLVGAGCGRNVILRNDPLSSDAQIQAEYAALTAIQAANATPIDLSFAPGEDPGTLSDSRFAIFGNVALTKRWSPRLVSALNYTRRENNGSGLGGSTVMDSFSLTTNWQVGELWRVALRTDWTLQKSLFTQTRTFQVLEPEDFGGTITPVARRIAVPGGLTAAEIDNDVDTQRWGVAMNVARDIGPNAVVHLILRYDRQMSANRTAGSSSDFGNFTATVGASYFFDPIRLW